MTRALADATGAATDATRARRVLVTGVGSGIGRAIAERLSGAGHRVIGTVRDGTRAATLSAEARAQGLPLEVVGLELTREPELCDLAARLEAGGGVDAVVHNAGYGVMGPIEEVSIEAATRQFAVNVLGPLALTRLLLPSLRRRKGRVVFIGSLAGRLALPFQAHYSASKAAVASLSDALRMELLPSGVAVTCVEPGDFRTGFTDARVVERAESSPYAARLEACRLAVEEQERGGPDPAWVARAVEGVLSQRRPPARLPVGRFAAASCLLLRVLPDSWRERLVLWNYDL